MSRILSYGCTSSMGPSTAHFWEALLEGKVNPSSTWTYSSDSNHAKQNSKEVLVSQLLLAWNQAKHAYRADQALGVILASTKGCIDDFIWNSVRPEEELSRDPLTPVLEQFLKQSELSALESVCVSNACASTLAALKMASNWLSQKRVEQVLILACDRVGPFVQKGFQSLHALTETVPKPFDVARDGLKLGEASAAILLSESAREGKQSFELCGVGLNTEGYAVTRPSPSGQSLKRAYHLLLSKNHPDFIIAHGTGTPLNDAAEDLTFSELFGPKSIPISGTKWCIGHTLATSAAMDVIAACEVLKNKKFFKLATTVNVDPSFQSEYLFGNVNRPERPAVKKVLISSLGFGGIHAMAEIGL